MDAATIKSRRLLGPKSRFGLASVACSLLYPLAVLIPFPDLSLEVWSLIVVALWFTPVTWILLPELREGFATVSLARLVLIAFCFLVATLGLTLLLWGTMGILFSLFQAWRYGA